MDEKTQITLLLEGPSSRDGNVRLGDLIHELQSLSSLLVTLDRALSPTGKATTRFEVTNLRRASPARIDIAATSREKAPDIRAQIFGSMFGTIRRLAEDEAGDYNPDILEALLSMSEPVGKRLALVDLLSNGYRASLTPLIRERITSLLAPGQTAFGIIRGKLEAVNLHAGANTCKIFPRSGPVKISGSFPLRLVPEISAGLGRMVDVHGLIQYRADQPYAHAIAIEKIEILPPPNSLPTFNDLRGVAPNLTANLSSEEWLEQRRHEREPELLALLGE